MGLLRRILNGRALRRGEGTEVSVSLMYRDTRSRSTHSLNSDLTQLVNTMIQRCPGLLLKQPTIIIGTEENSHAVSFFGRFMNADDANAFLEDCKALLRTGGFEA